MVEAAESTFDGIKIDESHDVSNLEDEFVRSKNTVENTGQKHARKR